MIAYDPFNIELSSDNWLFPSQGGAYPPAIDEDNLLRANIVGSYNGYYSSITWKRDGEWGTDQWAEVELGATLDLGAANTAYYDNWGYFGPMTNCAPADAASLKSVIFSTTFDPGTSTTSISFSLNHYSNSGAYQGEVANAVVTLESLFGPANTTKVPAGSRYRLERVGTAVTGKVWSPYYREYATVASGTLGGEPPTGGAPGINIVDYESPTYWGPSFPNNGLLGVQSFFAGEDLAVENESYETGALAGDFDKYHRFIQLSGITRTGCLQTDYRNAMAAALGISDANAYSIDDLYKRLYEQAYEVTL